MTKTKAPKAKDPKKKPAAALDRCCPPAPKVRRLKASELARTVAVFRALGDPTRLELFRTVAAHAEPICVCDLTDRFHVGQPTISHHLRVLREAGLVTVSRRGVWAHYAPDRPGIERARAAVSAVLPGSCATGG